MTLSRPALVALGFVAIFALAFTAFGWPRSSSAGGPYIIVNTPAGGANNHNGDCSLGEAITAANTDTQVDGCVDPTSDTIIFNLDPGDTTINVTKALPTITGAVTIDGTLGGGDPIELNGGGLSANGLTISSNDVTIRNLVIDNFGKRGIQIVSGINNLIAGNFIGIDTQGTSAEPNTAGGIEVDSSHNNIGSAEGTTPGESCTGDCNLISGNTGPGIELKAGADLSTVVGNLIGTDVSGVGSVPNGGGGILENADLVVIGGPLPKSATSSPGIPATE